MGHCTFYYKNIEYQYNAKLDTKSVLKILEKNITRKTLEKLHIHATFELGKIFGPTSEIKHSSMKNTTLVVSL